MAVWGERLLAATGQFLVATENQGTVRRYLRGFRVPFRHGERRALTSFPMATGGSYCLATGIQVGTRTQGHSNWAETLLPLGVLCRLYRRSQCHRPSEGGLVASLVRGSGSRRSQISFELFNIEPEGGEVLLLGQLDRQSRRYLGSVAETSRHCRVGRAEEVMSVGGLFGQTPELLGSHGGLLVRRVPDHDEAATKSYGRPLRTISQPDGACRRACR